VAIDHRGHGDSGGRDSSFGWHERHDVTAVSDHIRDTWPGEFRAAVGVSMGAAAVCFAAADGTNWHAVVLESVYDEVLATFRRRVTVGYHPAWFGGLIERAGWVTEWRLGVKFARMRPAEYVRELDGTPVLFVSGEDDPTVPPDRAREIARQHAGPGSLWLVPGAGHRDVFEKAGADYGRRVVDFLVSVRGGLSKAGRSAA
jgi:pimeloyl-ACP methyl ester carboxylesterase